MIVTTGHLASNPRVVKEATALAEAGHDVHVVHGHYSPWAAPYDTALIRNFTATKVPFGPHLASKGTYLHQSIRTRAARFLAARHPRLIPALATRAVAPIASDLVAAAARIPADLYIAHYTPALPAAMVAASRHAAAFAFDAEDFHPGDLPDEVRHATTNRIIAAIEEKALPSAAFITAASPGIADAYANRYGIARPSVLLNVFSRTDAPDRPILAGETQPHPSVYWFSQTVGGDRGLECAVRAIARAASKPHLHLRGTPAAGFVEALTSLAAAEGVPDRIHVLPPEAPDRMVALAARYDVGLVGETGATLNRRIALTNKQFTYLLAGIPTVMSDVPAHCAFAAEAEGAAFLYGTDDPDSLAATLDQLLGNPERLAEARRTAFRLGQVRYNWEVEKEVLLQHVENALSLRERTRHTRA